MQEGGATSSGPSLVSMTASRRIRAGKWTTPRAWYSATLPNAIRSFTPWARPRRVTARRSPMEVRPPELGGVVVPDHVGVVVVAVQAQRLTDRRVAGPVPGAAPGGPAVRTQRLVPTG